MFSMKTLTVALSALAVAALALGSSGCAVIWYEDDSGSAAANGTPVFDGDPAFATCALAPNPPHPPCGGFPNDTAYFCTDEPTLDDLRGLGCTEGGPNLAGYICCPTP